jgi:hypothetical protein
MAGKIRKNGAFQAFRKVLLLGMLIKNITD